MNSKEALKELEIDTNWSSDENIDKDLYNLWGNVACRIIKKDLEVLEILKTEIFNEEHCFDLDAGWYDDSFSLNENQIKVIKEWLDNE